MANRNKEIKDVVDLRSLKHKKFLSEWNAWVAGTYNIRKATIDNNTTVEFGRKVVANNNETANKVQIDQLKIDKADKTEVMKKNVDGSYTALLTTDKIVVNQNPNNPRYTSDLEKTFGFDITKNSGSPSESLDFKINSSNKISLLRAEKTLKTLKIFPNYFVKTENGNLENSVQSSLTYGELTLNSVDVKYEKMEYSGTYNAIAGTSVKVCRIPYNWRGKRIVVEFEARKTNSTVNALASFCYDGTTIPIKECKQNKDNTTWIKYLGTVILPPNWDKTRLKNGEKYHTDINTTIVGAFVDISVSNGNWDVKNIKVTLGEVSRPLQFATDSSECHLFNVPEAWRGCELEITYDLYNKGGERGTSIDVFNGPGVSNWIIRGGEDLGLSTGKTITKSGYLPYYINTSAEISNSFENLLYKSPRVGATFFTRSLNSNVNTLDFFEQNGFTIDSLSGKTLSDLTYFDFGISGGGNIIVGSSGIEFKNFKAKIKSIENTFDFFETGGVTFGDTSKFTFEELMTEKNIK